MSPVHSELSRETVRQTTAATVTPISAAAKINRPAPDICTLRERLGGTPMRFSADQHIAIEGSTNDQIVGIVSGVARCFKLCADGRRYICRFAEAGDFVGLRFSGEHIYSSEAVTDCEAIVFRLSSIRTAFEHDPQARQTILNSMSAEIARRERASFRLARMNADQRVADFLLEKSDEGRSPTVHLAMSRLDLADHLGLTFETVSRSLHKLERQHQIRIRSARDCDIRSIALLQRMVGLSSGNMHSANDFNYTVSQEAVG